MFDREAFTGTWKKDAAASDDQKPVSDILQVPVQTPLPCLPRPC